MSSKHSHYKKDVRHLTFIDPYRICDLYNVTHPALQHAIKKLLMPGERGAGKDFAKDIREAGDSITRCLQMLEEDEQRGTMSTVGGELIPGELVTVNPYKELVEQAVDVLVRHAPPDGLTDRAALLALYGIFDGPAYRAAIARRIENPNG